MAKYFSVWKSLLLAMIVLLLLSTVGQSQAGCRGGKCGRGRSVSIMKSVTRTTVRPLRLFSRGGCGGGKCGGGSCSTGGCK